MKVGVNVVFQVLAFVVQGANFVAGIVPVRYQPAIALIVSLSQAAVAWRAHFSNPDGTSAATPYKS